MNVAWDYEAPMQMLTTTKKKINKKKNKKSPPGQRMHTLQNLKDILENFKICSCHKTYRAAVVGLSFSKYCKMITIFLRSKFGNFQEKLIFLSITAD